MRFQNVAVLQVPLRLMSLVVLLTIAVAAHAQTATYHLHKEASTINTSSDKLLTTGPDATSVALTTVLTNKAVGEYLIKEFETQTSVPNTAGVIPNGSTLSFSLWMRKTANFGTVFPRAKIRLNNATGTLFCTATGATALTTTVTKQTFTCTTTANITMTPSDRFYLWVGVNLTATSSSTFSGEVDLEGTLNGNFDSQITLPLGTGLPTVTSLTPTSGAFGSSIVIAGTNFRSAQVTGSTVKFGGTQATTITNWSTSSITATVPTGAPSGLVAVTVGGQVNTTGPTFTVTSAPSITSIAPTSGAVGSSVVIAGANFNAQGTGSAVKFGTVPATSFSNWTTSSVTAVVPAGANGAVVVTAAGGVSSPAGPTFTLTSAPSITSIAPTSGAIGSSVTIAGTNFNAQGTGSAVSFGNTPATSITSWTTSSITAVVPSGAVTGAVTVTAAGGVTSPAGPTFTVVSAPSVTSLTPNTGAIGSSVTIAGTNFNAQGTGSAVTFSGTLAPITSWSSGIIVVSVPNGAVTGNVVVTADGGVAGNGVNFTVTVPPAIISLTPPTGEPGASITVAGNNFTGTTGTVTFNGQTASTTAWTSASITAVVPNGATNGNVVVTAGGLQSNGSAFTVLVPAISGLNPTSGTSGTVVTITGSNLGGSVGVVTFGGQSAAINSWSDSSIQAVVPGNAATGNVVVTAGALSSNGVAFTVVPATLTVANLTPITGAIGTQVRITGGGFGANQGSSTVSLGTANATAVSWSDTSIVAIVPVGGLSGPFSVSVNGQAASSPTFTVTPLPSGWIDSDIGSVGLAGSATYANGTFTVHGAGQQIYGNTDSFHFVYQPLSGDGAMVARVLSVQGDSTAGAAGVMIRETLDAGSVNAKTADWPTFGGIYFDVRTTTGGSTSEPSFHSATLPYWVKVARSGNTFTSYYASDGVNWVQMGTAQTINMAQNVYVGVAVTSGNTSALATAIFDNLSISSASTPVITALSPTTGPVGTQVTISGTGFGATAVGSSVTLAGSHLPVNSWSDTSIVISIPLGAMSGPLLVSIAPSLNNSNSLMFTVPLPSGWLNQDIGSTGMMGGVGYANGTFTVKAAGQQIYNSVDSFQFVYQPLSGDGTMVARLVSFQGSVSAGEAGVMIRETLDPTSANADLANWPAYGRIYFDMRATTSGSTSAPNSVIVTLPYWVKVVRSGNTFNGYYAPDGVNWVLLSTQTISMAQNVYVGLAVTSGNTVSLATAVFDNISISSASAPGPVITSVSADTGSIGSQVAITGSGFGASAGGSAVMLNNSPVTINSWSDTAIIITIPAGATSGVLSVSVAPSMNNSNVVNFAVTSQPLPGGWLNRDVGLVGMAGSATYSNGAFTVKGAGQQIYGTVDSFHFVYQPWSGDGAMIARVVSLQGNGPNGAVGVMFRETMDPASANVKTADWPAYNAIYFDVRATAGGSTSEPGGGVTVTLPYWVKVVRNGNTFSSYYSADGANWTQRGTAQTINMAQNLYLGLAVVGGNTTSLGTAIFDNVSITGGSTPVITGVSPTTGIVGTSVTIAGTNFGGSQGSSTLTFNGQPATSVTSWTDTQIVAIVPVTASAGPVHVVVNNVTSNSVTFSVPPPNVSSYLPHGGGIGTQVTITGTGFQPNQRNSTVTLHGVAATVTSWNDTQIVANVPTGATTGPLLVNVNSTSSSSGNSFEVSNPVIASITPPTAPGGGTVTITGSGFGPSMWADDLAVGSVHLNGLYVTVLTWSDTSLTVSLPQSATTGSLIVTKFNATSNSWPITIEGVATITGLAPSTGPVGGSVIISGSGFGATQYSSTVQFGDITAAITAWSDTQITAVVPIGAETGPVSVTVASVTSQTQTFVVNTSVQVTDSLGRSSSYTSAMLGGEWVNSSSTGSGCSSCTVRGTLSSTLDSNGLVLSSMDELGHVTSFTYDAANNMASQSAQLDSSTTVKTSYTYNSFGEPLTVTDPLGNTTTNAYDGNGNLLTVSSPKPDANTEPSVTHFAYDAKGQLTQITDPLTHITTLTYYPTGLINTIKDAQQNITTYEYDPRGNRTAVVDALTNRTEFQYDLGNRLKKIIYPGTTTFVTFEYDSRGRRKSVTDQNGKITTYTYDDADRLTDVKDAANNITHYDYDTENNLLSITDANNHATSFTYDAFGRVTQITFPSTLHESYIYDAAGNLTSKTDRNNHSILYVYDALNRLSHKGYPDSTGVDYIYDLAGKIKQVTDPTGTYGMAYDNMGRLIGTTTQYSFLPGHTYSNSYFHDAGSNRTGLTDPDGSTDTYVYDILNRLTTLTDSGAGQFTFGYDALSRRTQLTRPNGISSSYGYDPVSHLQSILHKLGVNTVDGATYAYDLAGNRTSKTNALNSMASTFAYDNIYQLTGVSGIAPESYTFDPVGNRLTSASLLTYSYNSSNRLTGSGSATYTFDSNGGTLTKTDTTGTTTYTWDFENRLTSVHPPNQTTVTFKYDPFGRRIQKGSSVYLYDGANLIEEADSGGNMVARYVFGGEVDEPLAASRGTSTEFYQADGLGSITSLSTTAGAMSDSFVYDSFGNVTSSTGSFAQPFRYTGREWDAETGLYYYRARYYDPAIGRFLSEDPIRSGINFYTYVINNPATFVDPLGLRNCTKTPLGVVCYPDGRPGTTNFDPKLPQLPAPPGLPTPRKPIPVPMPSTFCEPGTDCHDKIQLGLPKPSYGDIMFDPCRGWGSDSAPLPYNGPSFTCEGKQGPCLDAERQFTDACEKVPGCTARTYNTLYTGVVSAACCHKH